MRLSHHRVLSVLAICLAIAATAPARALDRRRGAGATAGGGAHGAGKFFRRGEAVLRRKARELLVELGRNR